MAYVRNTEALLAHGLAELRRPALAAVEAGLAAADPGPATRALVRREGRWLEVGDERIDLDAVGRVLLLGAGKASLAIAQALEEILGERLDGGVIAVKEGQAGTLRRARLRHAAHPVPDAVSLAAAQEIAALTQSTGPGDLVFAAFTGGSSALMAWPAPPLALADKQALTRLLLASGADIFEINAVRKHLSRLKGGRLARLLHPGARLVSLTVSDVVGDAFDYITDPTVPDTSTLADARATLDRYRLWDSLPPAVAAYLAPGGPAAESPKHLGRLAFATHLLVDSAAAARAARAHLQAAGFEARLHALDLVGDSATAGRDFAAQAGRLATAGRPVALVAAGETTVTLTGDDDGLGGPNQEFALAAGLALPAGVRAVVLGLDTDGSDGPTDFAGALADCATAARCEALGLDGNTALARHDSARLAAALDDAIVTGATGTNVNDLKLLLVG